MDGNWCSWRQTIAAAPGSHGLQKIDFGRAPHVVITSCWLCPPPALKDGSLRDWGEMAHQAARRAKVSKPARKPRRRKPAAV